MLTKPTQQPGATIGAIKQPSLGESKGSQFRSATAKFRLVETRTVSTEAVLIRYTTDAHRTDGVFLRMNKKIRSSRATNAETSAGFAEMPGFFLTIATSSNIPTAVNKAAAVAPNHASRSDRRML